jgi:hypothetical protein
MTAPQAAKYSDVNIIDYTPSSAVTGGTPTAITLETLGVPSQDIAASTKDALLVHNAIVKIVAAGVVGNIGDNVWWDNNGNPYGGTTGTGAATTYGPDGNYWIGTLAKALAATDTHAYVRWNVANPAIPHWPNRLHETITTGPLDVQDNGKVLWSSTGDTNTITLPAVAVGLDVVIMNSAADAGAVLNIDPNNNDKIMGQNLAGNDGGILANTKATHIRCDYVHLRGYHADGPLIVEKRGIWTVA